MARPQRKLSVTPFSAGKFERFCQSRGRTVEEISALTGITLRTLRRWMRGETFPVAESWSRLATAFGFQDGDALLIGYAEFLRFFSETVPQGEVAQPTRFPDDGGSHSSQTDAVREALRPLRGILDLDLSRIKPASRQILLHRSRGTLLTIASVIETEYGNFYQLLEK